MFDPSRRCPQDGPKNPETFGSYLLSTGRDALRGALPSQLRGALRESRKFLSPDPWVRGKAADSAGLAALTDGATLSYILELSGSPEPRVRECSARALQRVAPTNTAAEEQLVFLLEDFEQSVRRSAAWALISVICERCNRPLPASQTELAEISPYLRWRTPRAWSAQAADSLLSSQASCDPLVRLVASIKR